MQETRNVGDPAQRPLGTTALPKQAGGAPVRGSLRLSVSPSAPEVHAGSPFSIFVVIQNPFDVPITIRRVQTHIPVELTDVNRQKIEQAARERDDPARPLSRQWIDRLRDRFRPRAPHTGVALAVGTDFDPTQDGVVNMKIEAAEIGDHVTIAGIQMVFPENPSSEELDRLFSRIDSFNKGIVPTQLQPGDSVVRQFVLRTGRWLLFTPLTHTFQIQVDYSGDGVDHADTTAYPQSIRSTLGATAVGAMVGATGGTLMRDLTSGSAFSLDPSFWTALAVAVLGSVAVIVAFARKSSAQPIVSIEDFWGGALIGFSVGFLGFDQFSGLFSGTAP